MDSAGQLRPACCFVMAPRLHTTWISIIYFIPIFDQNQSSTMATMKRKAPEFLDAPDATPTGRPVKKLRLTQSQKQALIDNLQLESTSMGGVCGC